MDFKAHWFGLSVSDRDLFAQRALTSRGLLNQVAYRNKQIELGFADVICIVSGGIVTLDDLPLTDNAQRQRAIRDGADACAPKLPKVKPATSAFAEAKV